MLLEEEGVLAASPCNAGVQQQPACILEQQYSVSRFWRAIRGCTLLMPEIEALSVLWNPKPGLGNSRQSCRRNRPCRHASPGAPLSCDD